MPWLAAIPAALGAMGSAAGGAAGAAGGALGSAAGAAGSALGSAGSAIGSGLGSVGSSIGGALSKVPQFMGMGGGEAGKLSSLGQAVPQGVELAGPGQPLSAGESAVMFGSQTPPASFKAPGTPTFSGGLAKIQQTYDLLSPIMSQLGQQGQMQQPMAIGQDTLQPPSFEPAQINLGSEDPTAFLNAFRIQG